MAFKGGTLLRIIIFLIWAFLLSRNASIFNLNLYAYVGNNPLKYRDPTGHVKETPEQEAMEEGAVGGYCLKTISFNLPDKLN
jgi:hypothetical protein